MGSEIIKTLFLDTATNLLVTGLLDGKKSDMLTREGNQDNSAYAIDTIDKLLKRNGLTIDDIGCMVVGIGPGSYTGIRVAVMVAKMIASTKGIKLFQISSIAFLTSGYEYPVFGFIDARNGLGFSGFYQKAQMIEADKLRALDALTEKQRASFKALKTEQVNIDLKNILKASTEVKDIHNLVPAYLRKTEAERQYDQKGSHK